VNNFETNNTVNYENFLLSALKKGAELGYEASEHHRINKLIITTKHIEEIRVVLLKLIKGELSNLMGNCFPIHTLMKPTIEKVLGIGAYFTIGYLRIDGEYIHKMEIEDLLKILSPDVQVTGNLNLHAWITLPSMEIIDLTTMTTKNMAQNRSVNELAIIHGLSGTDNIEYFPQIAATL
jgi:hypothetical protein